MPDDVIRDANGYDYAQYPADRIARQQAILNTSWPFKDAKGEHARGLDDKPVEAQIDCTVRLEFERDGDTWLPGTATRWNRSHVFVVVDDPRMPHRLGVWVLARDVRRV